MSETPEGLVSSSAGEVITMNQRMLFLKERIRAVMSEINDIKKEISLKTNSHVLQVMNLEMEILKLKEEIRVLKQNANITTDEDLTDACAREWRKAHEKNFPSNQAEIKAPTKELRTLMRKMKRFLFFFCHEDSDHMKQLLEQSKADLKGAIKSMSPEDSFKFMDKEISRLQHPMKLLSVLGSEESIENFIEILEIGSLTFPQITSDMLFTSADVVSFADDTSSIFDIGSYSTEIQCIVYRIKQKCQTEEEPSISLDDQKRFIEILEAVWGAIDRSDKEICNNIFELISSAIQKKEGAEQVSVRTLTIKLKRLEDELNVLRTIQKEGRFQTIWSQGMDTSANITIILSLTRKIEGLKKLKDLLLQKNDAIRLMGSLVGIRDNSNPEVLLQRRQIEPIWEPSLEQILQERLPSSPSDLDLGENYAFNPQYDQFIATCEYQGINTEEWEYLCVEAYDSIEIYYRPINGITCYFTEYNGIEMRVFLPLGSKMGEYVQYFPGCEINSGVVSYDDMKSSRTLCSIFKPKKITT